MRELTIESIISRVDELPEVPQIAFKVISLLNNPETAAVDLAEVISRDQALTAKLLRLCNSAFYSLQRQVTTISEAVVIVGFGTIKSMVMMITTQGAMNKGLIGYRIGPGELWNHSLGVAEVAKDLAVRAGYKEPEEAFIAGLIHDIGKMVLNQHALPEVYKATNLYQKGEMSLDEAERSILGFDHASIGAALVEKWGLPAVLVHSIRSHHALANIEVREKQKAPLPLVVFFANLIMHMFVDENAYETFALNQDVVEQYFGINESRVPALLTELKEKVQQASAAAMAIC